MLEQDIRDTYRRMADADMPPSPVSIPAASRRGQARLRTRRASVIAAPALAAMAVVAIAVTGAFSGAASSAPPARHGHPAPAAPQVRPKVPEPFVAFGWLPAGLSLSYTSVGFGQGEGLAAAGRHTTQEVDLSTFTRGSCSLTSKMICSGQLVVTLVGRAPDVRGRRAYWAPDNQLAFQVAPHIWALATFPTQADDLQVAEHLITGRRVQPLRYPARLTGTPYRDMLSAAFSYANGRPESSDWLLAAGINRRNQPVHRPPSNWLYSPGIAIAKAGSVSASPCQPLIGELLKPGHSRATPLHGSARHVVINGYQVLVSGLPAYGGNAPSAEVCANNADGLYVLVSFNGNQAVAAATQIFTDLKLYGTDPADWTTRPLG
jgi:hypothetical protein